jgi:hypothetical protein
MTPVQKLHYYAPLIQIRRGLAKGSIPRQKIAFALVQYIRCQHHIVIWEQLHILFVPPSFFRSEIQLRPRVAIQDISLPGVQPQRSTIIDQEIEIHPEPFQAPGTLQPADMERVPGLKRAKMAQNCYFGSCHFFLYLMPHHTIM